MSKKVLNIISSPRGDNSVSKKLGNTIVGKILEKYPESEVVVRDVATHHPPHLTEEQIVALFTPEKDRTAIQQNALKYSDEVIAELQSADIIVLNTPLYEFSISAMLKAYLDQIVRVGVTFHYNESGFPVGQVLNKKLYIAVASGGVYSEGFMQDYDFVVPYLKKLLGFIGITDISVVRAEGLSKGTQEEKELAFQKGVDSIVID